MSKILEAPLSLKADVWTHFGFKAKEGNQGIDKTNAICKHCQASIRYTGNTTNLRSHLQRHHADKLASPQSKKTRDPTQTTLDNTTSKLPSNSVRAQKITESVVHYICKGLCPYSVVENTGFRFMINTLDPRYMIPTRSYMTDKAVPRIYDKVKDDVKSALSSAPRVALTCDGWTSRATEAFVTITCHYVDEEWELMSHVLQTRAMHESHTGSNIAELLKAALEEWDLEEAKVIPGEEDNHVEDKDDIPASPPPKKKKDLCCLADLLGSTYSAGPAVRHRTTQAQAEEEMSRYKEAPPLSLAEGSPLSWWK
ncbi:hypothetical protein M9458_053722 [Cirrhinus mrigala]|uniref:BED-type domain-containing protein n=1 Tax=Cirrhinus mrigala TaxID=683832 RepID=A0ABD0MLK3_CIRMR